MSSCVQSVGMGEIEFSNNGTILAVFGLGSCVAVALFDDLRKQGALCHIVLPEPPANTADDGRYASTAIIKCIQVLIDQGSSVTDLKAKIAGGANLFPGSGSGIFNDIGSRNIKTVQKLLREQSIAVAGSDVGGCKGRTVMFYPTQGHLQVRRTGEQPFVL